MAILLTSLMIIAGAVIPSSYYIVKQFGILPRSYYELEHKEISYHENGTFVSPEELVFFPERTTGGKVRFTRFFKTSEYAPKDSLPKVMLNKSSFGEEPDNFSVYWLGHSSAILDLDGKRILIDPVFDNAAFFPGIVPRYEKSPLKKEELPELDIVLITHDHYDHLEYATIRHLMKREGIKFIVPFGVGERLKGWGVHEQAIQELKWDEKAEIKGIEITAMKAVHYSGRSWFDRNQSLWASYGIKSKDKNIFWSGDTGYGEHFKVIGDKYGPFDFAEMILPIHWGVFDLAFHPWDESINMLVSEAEKQKIHIMTPMIGEKIIPKVSETKFWWK